MQCDDKEEYTFAVPRLPHPQISRENLSNNYTANKQTWN